MGNFNTKIRALFTPIATPFQGVSSTAELQAIDNSSPGVNISIPVPAKTLSDRRFVVEVTGRCTAAAGNFTLKLYDGTKSGQLIATSGAVAFATGSFRMIVELTSDPTSNTIQGTVRGHIGSVIIPLAAITSATFNPAIDHTLTVSGTMSSSNAGNNFQVRSLELDVL